MDVEFPSANAWALLYILRGLGSVSLCGTLPPACASCYPNFLHLLSPQFAGKSPRISKLLQTAVARAQCRMMLVHLDVRLNAVQTSQLKQRGEKACIFHWLISHHSLFCPSQQGKLAHAELCTTVGETFLMNQSYLGYVYAARQCRHSHIYIDR